MAEINLQIQLAVLAVLAAAVQMRLAVQLLLDKVLLAEQELDQVQAAVAVLVLLVELPAEP
jgi:hypothetical protein